MIVEVDFEVGLCEVVLLLEQQICVCLDLLDVGVVYYCGECIVGWFFWICDVEDLEVDYFVVLQDLVGVVFFVDYCVFVGCEFFVFVFYVYEEFCVFGFLIVGYDCDFVVVCVEMGQIGDVFCLCDVFGVGGDGSGLCWCCVCDCVGCVEGDCFEFCYEGVVIGGVYVCGCIWGGCFCRWICCG